MILLISPGEMPPVWPATGVEKPDLTVATIPTGIGIVVIRG
jgi:hypothetical protein